MDIVKSKFDIEFTIMGDMNINYRDRHSKSFELLKEFERVYNFTQLISDYTRVTSKSKSTIDLIWTDMSHINSSGILDIHVSDHMPVYMVKKKQREEKEFKYITVRSYKRYERECFQDDIIHHKDWGLFWDIGTDPEKLWEIMESIILDCAELHCPQKRMKIRDNSPTWLCKEIIKLYYKDDL